MKHGQSCSTVSARIARALLGLALTALAWAVLTSRAVAADYTVTTTSNAMVVTDLAGNGDLIEVTEPSAGNIRFAATGRTFSVNGGATLTNSSGNLSRSNINSITINAGAGADTIYVLDFTGTLPSLTINGGSSNDAVFFAGNITFAANANLDVDLQNDVASPGADVVNVWANLIVSGTGSITVRCSKSMSVSAEGSLQTVNGNLTVEANQQAVATPGDFTGVTVDGLVRCTGTGQVVVRGRGGDSEGGYQLGVLLWYGGQIIGGTSGTLIVEGTGGASTNLVNRGVTVYGTGALISSLGGPVQVTGWGGSQGSFFGIGVSVLYGGVISAGGMGSVTVTGTGAGFGGANQGVEMSEPGSAIYSGGGTITVTGTAGPGGSYGILATTQASIINTNAGNSIRLIADSIYIANNASVIAGGTATIKPKSGGVVIDLGGFDAVGRLGLEDAELDLITASTIIIGDTNANPITITAPISPANTAALRLVSGAAIRDTYTGGADAAVANLTTDGNLSPGAPLGLFSVAGNHTLATSSSFTVQIGGITPGTQHDQLSATGSVTIGTNVTLSLAAFGSFSPIGGQNFMIVSRTGGSGFFAGLPQGATITNFLGSGLSATISYTNGTGDDVVLTTLGPEIVVEQPAGVALEDRNLVDQYAATVLDFSSAYGGAVGDWGANQVLGVPDTFSYGDIPTAWATVEPDGELEFITVGFATPVHATGATVRETSANGFVYQIDVLDTNDVLHTVWTGIDPSLSGTPVNFQVTWAETPYLVKGLKVYVDTDHVAGEWEEIDSIQLHGITNSVVHFGVVNFGSSSNLTFTIRNTGNANLTGLGITIDGANAGDFAVATSPTAPVSGPSGSTTFTVRFTPAAGGARNAALHIASNDSDENPFDIVLAGRATTITDNLIGYWNFDEGTGATLIDHSGYGNNGALRNFPGTNSQWVAGQVGGALNFGGAASQNWVYVTNYPKPTTTMTLSAWVLTSSRAHWASIAKNWGGTPTGFTGQFHLGLTADDGTLSNYQTENDGGVFVANEGILFPLGTWQHVAFVCDGSVMRLYRNGTQVASTPYDGTILNAPVMSSLAIGCKTGDSGLAPDSVVPGFWHGNIDDLAIWNRGLSPEEILAIYSEGVNGHPLPDAMPGAIPPVIQIHPAGTNSPPGANVTLCVTATGTPPLSYQWRRNGVNIPGTNGSCLTLAGAQAQDGGSYEVVVYNAFGSALSGPAPVVITVPVLAPGDHLANRVSLLPSNGTVRASNLNATSEPGEPAHVGKPGGRSVWYSFTSAQAGVMNMNTAGSSIDTLLAVYTGSTIPALVGVVADEESGGALTSEVRFNVAANVEYVIAVDGYGGVMGDFVLTWNFQQTTAFYPVITVQPASITVAPGVNQTFTANVTGSGLIYQWSFNGNTVPGATNNSLTIANVQETSVGTYVLRTTQGARWVDTRPVSLQMNLTGGSAQPVQAADKFLDASLLSSPILLGQSPNPFAPFSPASINRGYTGTQTFNTFGAASAVGEPQVCEVRGGATEWIHLLAEQSGELYLNTDGSSFNTVMAVFDRVPGVAGLHYLGCDNNGGIDGIDSALVVPVVGGRTNYIQIDGVNGATGVLKLNYNLVVTSTLTPLGLNGSGQYRFLVTGRPNMSFTIQYTTNFTTWTNLYSGTDADGSYLFTDTSPLPPAGRFYRLLMRP